jgi:hypothetical protein
MPTGDILSEFRDIFQYSTLVHRRAYFNGIETRKRGRRGAISPFGFFEPNRSTSPLLPFYRQFFPTNFQPPGDMVGLPHNNSMITERIPWHFLCFKGFGPIDR